ncbi:MAG TPA: DUF3821 domain-containing protein [Methanoregulaceae archaeon]|nr:DUF3821 domain-containing protein [Methanoregulaceae archaeon]HQJ87736.1 DUF3821 domain-containing protein [Methanoregulaceae archaeon]
MRRAILLVFLLLLVAGTADATIRVLPLGDSLTKGSTQTPQEANHPTYRYWLWQQISDLDVDFVGSWTAPNFAYSFDQDNEGHGGYMTAGILNGVSADPRQGRLSLWLAQYDFDVALVMLGTNDVLNNVPTEETIRNLEGIIAELRNDNPHAVILLAQIPPTSIPRPNLNALNAAIPGVATRLSTPDSPVVIVDMYSGYDGVADNQPPTGIHPAESGEKKIAARWYAALRPFLPGSGAPTPTVVPTVTRTRATPGPIAPNVIRSPGATVYSGERGLDITATGVGSGDTLGWFVTQSPEGMPAATLRIEDPRRVTIPHDARTGRWFNLDRDREFALLVEEPALSLRLVDTATGGYVTGGTIAKGRSFNLEVSGELSAFRTRGTGAPVAIRVQDPSGRISATLVGDDGVRQSLERIMVVQTPHIVRGTTGAAWNTGDPAYPAGEYAIWAEALLDHEHGTASPDPNGAVGRQVSATVQLRLVLHPTRVVTTPGSGTTVPAPSTAIPVTPVSTPTPANTTLLPPASTTVSGPAATTDAPLPPVTGETPWWLPFFLAALAVVFIVAGGGIWWALRSPGRSEEPRLVTAPPRVPARRVPPRETLSPAVQSALERVRTFDPERGEVQALKAALRTLERAEQARQGRIEVDLLSVIPPSAIPTMPIPDSIRRWARRVGFVPLSFDGHGSTLFYAPVLLQGGTRLVVKRADELPERR